MSRLGQTGDTMTTNHNSKFPVCERVQRVHDVLMVSSFALWAMVLGFMPVVTCRLLGMLMS